MIIDKALLHQLYIVEKKSVLDISKIIDKSLAQVSRYLKKFEIPTRAFSTKGLKPRLGAILSEDTKEKIRIAHQGKKLSEDHRQKVIKTLRNGQKEANPNWKGGKYIDDWGYVKIKVRQGYQFEHRNVLERFLKRKLTKNEHIHHINGIKTDNEVENLIILSPEDHAKLHNQDKIWQRYDKRKKKI